MSEYPYVGCDTETTGLNHKVDEILEVAMIEFNDEGEIGERIVQLCSPHTGYIPKGASDINGITIEKVAGCPNYLKDGVRERVADFLGDRILIGHNIDAFDLRFLKIQPKKTIDTLRKSKKMFTGRHNLRAACRRVGIDWDNEKAHGSEYDTLKTIELFIKMKEIESEKGKALPKSVEIDMFDNNENVLETKTEDLKAMGIDVTDDDKKLIATQAYSYSRINLFEQCPYKWYLRYIRGFQEPSQEYFTTGKICHKVAEWCGDWCYQKLFLNKFESYCGVKEINIPEPYKNNTREYAKFLYENPGKIKDFFPNFRGRAGLINDIDISVPQDSYECPSMPDRETFDKMFTAAVNKYNCSNPDTVYDARKIMDRFYGIKDFSLTPGDITITEKKLAFDKNWKVLSSFFSRSAFFRAVIDVLDYFGDCVIITDYKSSRKMLTQEKMKDDRQLQCYVLATSMFLPKGSYKRMIIRIEYIRYGKTIQYEVEDIDEMIEKAMSWINDSIQKIEKEMMKTDGKAFQPTRNEYCHTCYIAEDGKCPLFNKQFIDDIEDPYSFNVTNMEECKRAWKRVEANKAENKKLQKQCKAFIESADTTVRVDEHALLDFYVSESRDFDAHKAAKALLEKEVDIEFFLRFFNVTAGSFEKLCEIKEIKFTEEELDAFSKIKKKTEFNAFTEKEAKDKKFLNS